MRTISRLGVVLAFFNLCWSLSAHAEAAACAPKFTSSEFNLSTGAGELFELDLRSLLVDPLAGETLQWGTFGAAPPAWLEPIPAPGEKLRGTPTVNDSGTQAFNLSVQCGDSGALTQIRISVIIVPKWKNAPNELFLGDIPEDGTLDLNLKDHVTTADNNPNVTFTATGLGKAHPGSYSSPMDGYTARPRGPSTTRWSVYLTASFLRRLIPRVEALIPTPTARSKSSLNRQSGPRTRSHCLM
ncbi:MAG: hypothetical protein R3B54_16885 [Bdellovibrionota bacterium]